jgi:hypothetical protein
MIGISRSIFKKEPHAPVPSDAWVEFGPRHEFAKTTKKQHSLNFIIVDRTPVVRSNKSAQIPGRLLFVQTAGIVVSAVTSCPRKQPINASGGRGGTGQIREKVKEDENGIGIAVARSLSSQAG